MKADFTTAQLGNTGITSRRMALSASYFPGKKTVHAAVDSGVTTFFCYGFDIQMTSALRDLFKTGREKFVVVTGAYNFIWGYGDIRKSFEKRLRQLKTDYLDFFLFLGVMKPEQLPQRVVNDLHRLKDEGKVRGIGISCHDRKLIGSLAESGTFDTFMLRYNAAHRGAESDIFPHLAAFNPTVISYTATRWRQLLARPGGWPKTQPVPDAAMCYRFVLSNPHVDVVLTAPTNRKQLAENLKTLEQGPLTQEEMLFMRRFGDAVHSRRKWFM